jgi:hypothetical protein
VDLGAGINEGPGRQGAGLAHACAFRNTESNEEKDVKHMSKFLALTAGVAVSSLAFGQVLNPQPASEEGVVPTYVLGNFSGFDDQQACYDFYGSDKDVVGFKIDPPVGTSDDFVTVTLSADGKYLAWSIVDGKMIAIVVKGGNGYNLYNYIPFDLTSDEKLQSPSETKNRKIVVPQISHYNVCYEPNPPADEDFQGCTPGYWRNHADRWVGVASTDDFDATFDVDLFSPNITLGKAIWAPGGGNNALARHATAALLNAHAAVAPGSNDQQVNYPYSVAYVIKMVQDAVAGGTIEQTKNALAAANELGCPLSGTSAVPVTFVN